jgi:hypothetical protein
VGSKADKVRPASVEIRFMRTEGHTPSGRKGKDEMITELKIPQITIYRKKQKIFERIV